MNTKALLTVCVLITNCNFTFGQTSYGDLTPGKSTRTEAESVLGRPIRVVSDTFAQYDSPDGVPWRLFVQYRTESATAIVERIERTCVRQNPGEVGNADCLEAVNSFNDPLEKVLWDVYTNEKKPDGPVFTYYFGAPRFLLRTTVAKAASYESRLAYYSRELYDSTVTKSGCNGTIFGTWLTDRGRMTVKRVGGNGIEGTYAKNNGSFNLTQAHGGFIGEWKDDTGSGTMALLPEQKVPASSFDSFSATWTRAAQGPGRTTPGGDVIGSKAGSAIEKITRSGDGAAVGAVHRDTSETRFRIIGLPAGQSWKGKCVP